MLPGWRMTWRCDVSLSREMLYQDNGWRTLKFNYRIICPAAVITFHQAPCHTASPLELETKVHTKVRNHEPSFEAPCQPASPPRQRLQLATPAAEPPEARGSREGRVASVNLQRSSSPFYVLDSCSLHSPEPWTSCRQICSRGPAWRSRCSHCHTAGLRQCCLNIQDQLAVIRWYLPANLVFRPSWPGAWGTPAPRAAAPRGQTSSTCHPWRSRSCRYQTTRTRRPPAQ